MIQHLSEDFPTIRDQAIVYYNRILRDGGVASSVILKFSNFISQWHFLNYVQLQFKRNPSPNSWTSTFREETETRTVINGMSVSMTLIVPIAASKEQRNFSLFFCFIGLNNAYNVGVLSVTVHLLLLNYFL